MVRINKRRHGETIADATVAAFQQGQESILDFLESLPVTKPGKDSITQFAPFITLEVYDIKALREKVRLAKKLNTPSRG